MINDGEFLESIDHNKTKRRLKAMQDNNKEIHYQLKNKQLDWFIATDKYHLLRDEETYLGYQLRRGWCYLKYKFNKG